MAIKVVLGRHSRSKANRVEIGGKLIPQVKNVTIHADGESFLTMTLELYVTAEDEIEFVNEAKEEVDEVQKTNSRVEVLGRKPSKSVSEEK